MKAGSVSIFFSLIFPAFIKTKPDVQEYVNAFISFVFFLFEGVN